GCIGTKTSAPEPGGNGTLLPDGLYDSLGTLVIPSSLYLAQLCERLGPTALTNVGYDSTFCVSQGTPDFSLTAAPGTQTITAGGSISYTVNVSPINGFGGTVNLNMSGLPAGASAGFTPTAISGGSGSATLSIATSLCATPGGSYPLTITGTSGSVSHSATVVLVVDAPGNDFMLTAAPASQSVTAGGTTSYTVSVGAINCLQSNVGLSVSGLPSGASASFTPGSISGGSGSSTLSISTSNSTQAGSYPLTIMGTDGGSLSHTANVTLVVNAMSGGLSPGWTGPGHRHAGAGGERQLQRWDLHSQWQRLGYLEQFG